MHASQTRPPARAPGTLYAALACGVAALSFAAFARSLDAGFVSWDDGLTVSDNFAIRGLSAEHLRWMWTTSWAGHYQPLAWLSLALDHAAWGLTPPDFPEAGRFHATSLALHAAGAVALFALALALLARALPGAQRETPIALAVAAAAAALFHGLHPLRAESVCWITERRDVLSLPLLLLALWAWLRATPSGPAGALRPGWLAACAAGALAAAALAAASVSLASPERLALRGPGAAGLAAAGALLGFAVVAAARGVGGAPVRGIGVGGAPVRGRSAWLLASHLLLLLSLCAKAWGLVVPALLVVLDVWPLRRPRRGALLALAVEKLPALVLALTFARLAAWAQTAQQQGLDVLAAHTPGERLVQALYGLSFYPAKTLLPVGLTPLYPLPDALRLSEPRFALAALATLATLALCLALARRAPALLAAWVAFALCTAPVLGVLQSGPQLVADRYAQLAGVPFALLFGGALLLLWRRAPRRRGAALAATALVLALLAALAWRQSAIWRDSAALWTHAYAHAPESPLAALNLALVRAEQAESASEPAAARALRAEALELVRAAAARRPGAGLYAINEAILRARAAEDLAPAQRARELEQAAQQGAVAIAAEETRGAASGAPRGAADASWYWQHGRILAAQGDREGARSRYEQAIARRPEWPLPRLWLAALLLEAAEASANAEPERALAALARAEAQLAAAGPVGGARSVAAARARAAALRQRLSGASSPAPR